MAEALNKTVADYRVDLKNRLYKGFTTQPDIQRNAMMWEILGMLPIQDLKRFESYMETEGMLQK